MKKSKKSRKPAKSNIAANNLTAFMKGMEDDDTRQIIVNLQAALEFKEEELRIYRKKFTEATGKDRPDLTDDERRGLARKGKELNKLLLSLVDGSWSPQTVRSFFDVLFSFFARKGEEDWSFITKKVGGEMSGEWFATSYRVALKMVRTLQEN